MMDRTHLNILGAMMISAAADLNAEIVHRDNKIESAFEKLQELEESVADIRAELEGDSHAQEAPAKAEGLGPLTTIMALRKGAVFQTRGGIRALKSEYADNDGTPHCYLLASGERAHFYQKEATFVREVLIKVVP